jgi:secondary thiamine-phosphate synthase enzyme
MVISKLTKGIETKMVNSLKKIQLETKKQFEVVDITAHVQNYVSESGVKNGIAVVFCPHTTGGVRLNHNEPLLIQDFMKMLYNVAPNERSNGHAHVKAFLLGSSETLPIEKSALAIGSRQSVFFIELDGGRSREVYIKILGE